MRCRDVRSARFDLSDGLLSQKEQIEIERHLASCVSCSEFLAKEERCAMMYKAAFAERIRAHPFVADTIRFPSGDNQQALKRLSNKRIRFLKILLPISAAAVFIFISLTILSPTKKGDNSRAFHGSVAVDDLPDPFRDWIDRRMVIIIEDKVTRIVGADRGEQEWHRRPDC